MRLTLLRSASDRGIHEGHIHWAMSMWSQDQWHPKWSGAQDHGTTRCAHKRVM